MATWVSGELGNFITLKRGYDLPKHKREGGNISIFSSAGISGTHSAPMAEGPGVITGRYGTIGEVFFTEESYWPLNTTLYVEDFHGNYPKFIYYFLKTINWDEFTSASAVPGINRNVVHKKNVRIPDPLYQQKIATILDRIDGKININKMINDNLAA